MPDPEAELQATANLSPVSPSPVHTASPLVVPALQDTVDTIDAMVAAAVASTSQTGENTAPDGAVDSLLWARANEEGVRIGLPQLQALDWRIV